MRGGRRQRGVSGPPPGVGGARGSAPGGCGVPGGRGAVPGRGHVEGVGAACSGRPGPEGAEPRWGCGGGAGGLREPLGGALLVGVPLREVTAPRGASWARRPFFMLTEVLSQPCLRRQRRKPRR